jgi:hypothetical protein
MIKANELRVGNWITSQYKEKPFKVTGGLIAAMDDGMDEYSLEGIPLTWEIFEKCGFIEKRTKWRAMYKKSDVTIDVSNIGGITFYYLFGRHGVIVVSYLHQLQNLYFALTGEELTLDLCTNA